MLALTCGKPFSWSQFISSINPLDHVFTGLYDPGSGGLKTVGQIYQSGDLDGAQLHYLLPSEDQNTQDMVILLEGLIHKAGHWGAKYVIADLSIDSPLFGAFRQTGFSALAKQRVFRCETAWEPPKGTINKWRIWTSKDVRAMRSLYATLVPPVIQTVEPLTKRKMLGLVYYDQDGDLKAYADLVYGPIGAWVLPFVHPQTKEHPLDLLGQLIHDLPDLNSRTVYLITRSYQPWLENALATSSASPGPEQALMIRYLALRQRVRTEFSFGTVESGNPEPTVPLAPIKNNQQ
ncbi:MAG: hypothetical protein SVP52_02490 [Chloroflexota bacterium]|nr:hypothetical protein [Chloroflexota bacterium]